MYQRAADRGATKKAHKQETVNKKKKLCHLLFDLLWLHTKLILETVKEGTSVSLLCIHLLHLFIIVRPHYIQKITQRLVFLMFPLFPLCVKLIHKLLFELFLIIAFL